MRKEKNSDLLLSAKLDFQISNDVVEFLLQGYKYSDIVEYLEITYNLTKKQIQYSIQEGRKQIIELGEFDLETVIVQHIMNYEEATRFFDEIKNYAGKAAAMSGKEKLLKIYEEETNTIEIENNIDLTIESQQLFNIDKLSEIEKNRLENLFKKITIK